MSQSDPQQTENPALRASFLVNLSIYKWQEYVIIHFDLHKTLATHPVRQTVRGLYMVDILCYNKKMSISRNLKPHKNQILFA